MYFTGNKDSDFTAPLPLSGDELDPLEPELPPRRISSKKRIGRQIHLHDVAEGRYFSCKVVVRCIESLQLDKPIKASGIEPARLLLRKTNVQNDVRFAMVGEITPTKF